MSKAIAVVFFNDGTHQVLGKNNGIMIHTTGKAGDVLGVYVATSKTDADFVIQVYSQRFKETGSLKDESNPPQERE